MWVNHQISFYPYFCCLILIINSKIFSCDYQRNVEPSLHMNILTWCSSEIEFDLVTVTWWMMHDTERRTSDTCKPCVVDRPGREDACVRQPHCPARWFCSFSFECAVRFCRSGCALPAALASYPVPRLGGALSLAEALFTCKNLGKSHPLLRKWGIRRWHGWMNEWRLEKVSSRCFCLFKQRTKLLWGAEWRWGSARSVSSRPRLERRRSASRGAQPGRRPEPSPEGEAPSHRPKGAQSGGRPARGAGGRERGRALLSLRSWWRDRILRGGWRSVATAHGTVWSLFRDHWGAFNGVQTGCPFYVFYFFYLCCVSKSHIYFPNMEQSYDCSSYKAKHVP